MSDLDQLNNDLLALVANYLSTKDLLFFLRSHRRFHQLNSTSNSFAVSAWANSHLTIRVNPLFHSWLIPGEQYIRKTSRWYASADSMFISLSTWHSIRSAVVSVFQYWINSVCCDDDMMQYSDFDLSLAKKLMETSENPDTKIVTLE